MRFVEPVLTTATTGDVRAVCESFKHANASITGSEVVDRDQTKSLGMTGRNLEAWPEDFREATKHPVLKSWLSNGERINQVVSALRDSSGTITGFYVLSARGS